MISLSVKIDRLLLTKVIRILDKYYNNPIFTLNILKSTIISK